MTNRDKLRALLIDILLLRDEEFRFDLLRTDVDSWDSLSVVAVATGLEETFGYHMSEREAVAITGVADLIEVLEQQGVSFAE
jgi:acyl carrier protein